MTEPPATSIRALVIDDHRTMRAIVRRLLGQIGIMDVEEADNGETALELLHSPSFKDPDIIICDLHMEKMDGIDFCNKIRRTRNNAIRGIPVIVLTGEQDTLMHDVTRQVGAVTVLVKPISAANLKAQIEAAVGVVI